MGSCVSSSHNKSSSASDSAVKQLAAIISKSDTIKNDVITPATTINGNPPIDSGRRDPGDDKEDEMIFFDSRGWLDSDCDDDFMSVNGEFTPSRGSTPVHHKFSDQTPKTEEESPTDNKKRLLELFKETQDDEDNEEDDVAESKARAACLWLRTPVRTSAPATPFNNNNDKERQQHQLKRAAAGGCVPRLVSCSSFTERRRKMMSHAPIDVQR